LAASHPAGTDLGVEMDVHLILKNGRFIRRHLGQEAMKLSQFFCTIWVRRAYDRPWTPPHKTQAVQPAAHRLTTEANTSFPRQDFRKGLARPARAKVPKILRRSCLQPSLNPSQPTGTTPLGRTGCSRSASTRPC
jgi:hypothetical protein